MAAVRQTGTGSVGRSVEAGLATGVGAATSAAAAGTARICPATPPRVSEPESSVPSAG